MNNGIHMELTKELAHRDEEARRESKSGEMTAAAEPAQVIAIAATFTADSVRRPLNFWMEQLEIPAEIKLAPYAQMMQELLSPNSLLSNNQCGIDLLLVRIEDWIRDRRHEDVEKNLEHLRHVSAEFTNAVQALLGRTGSNIVIFFGPSFSTLSPVERRHIDEIQNEVCARLSDLSRVHCCSHADIARLYEAGECEDAHADRIAHIPYTDRYFVAIATLVARKIATLVRSRFKVIAIDCDNTLWRGVCGEDGVHGVEITPAHRRFQEMLVRQHDSGMLLCLCSKNNQSDVEAVFKAHPDMPLREEHLVRSCVNWQSKSSNLQRISAELDLSLDSFIFIDDSSLECSEVRTHCPSVLTLQIPETQEDFAHFIDHVWAFDLIEITPEAKQRTAQYKKNIERKKLASEAQDLQDFLASLELKVDIAPVEPLHLSRVAELTQRTNQFNLTTIRRSLGEIEMLRKSKDIRVLVVHVQDRFGDYGLVGVVILRNEPSSLEVDTFLLSCRVLGRRVEHKVINELGRIARQEGRQAIVLRYRHTPRNGPAWEFLERSFVNFRSASKSNGQSFTDTTFIVPAEYAEKLSCETDGSASSEQKAPAASTNSSQPTRRIHHWHEVAYRFSRLDDVMQEIDRSLPRRRGIHKDYVAPKTPMEVSLATIWTEVLGSRGRIGTNDDFFELGGDSLLAIQVIARIGSVLGAELSIYDFFVQPTIEKIAEKIGNASPADSCIARVDRNDPIPLSRAQQRLWFLDQLQDGSAAYHIPIAFRLQGRLDRVALQAALDEIVERHEALRTVFVRRSGEVVQHIAEEGCFSLQLYDLSWMDQEVQESRIVEISKNALSASFNLSEGPLIRANLLQLSGDEHVLLIVMHHIISDGWSLGVLVRELGALYAAHLERQPDPLPSLPIQYADFACWQRQTSSESRALGHLKHWTEHLKNAPELLHLPTDRPRPPAQSYRGGNIRVSLGVELSANLKAFAHSQNVTLAMVFYTALVVLLSRVTGQKDIVVGMPISGRQRTELEGLIGFFVNTLAVRVQLEDDPKIVDLLQRAKEAMLGAYVHQDVPFEQVVETVRPARNLSHGPIFQVMLAYQNMPTGVLMLPGLNVTEQEVPLPAAQFDLSLSLQEVNEELTGNWNYASDLFDVETVKRWGKCFEAVLRAMVENPQEEVTGLPLLAEHERRQLIEGFNTTGADYPNEKLIHELFEEQVERTPEAVAVVYEGRSLTYKQLNEKANQLAWYLRDQGVRPDQLTGLCVERSLEMLVGVLGVLKAGGAYLPMDPSYPAERLAFMLKDANPAWLLTQVHLRDRLANTTAKTVSLDGDWGELAKHSTHNLDAKSLNLRSHHLAYVIYTSGSTGQPKGVMIEHRNAMLLWHGLERLYQKSAPCRRVALNASINFDASVQQWMQLLSGRTVFMIPQQLRQDASMLLRFISDNEIDGIDCTPSQLKAWIASGLLNEDKPQMVLVGGEAIDAELWSRLARCTEKDFFNVYGPTECTVDVTAAHLRGDTAAPHIGRPMENRRIYIMDRQQPVPIGVAGEIYVGGVGVGRGYLNRPELTRERFLPDPFSSDPLARMYKTGDIGRWRADGKIEYLGRNDHQVKIRGYRIELGEIEAQLLRHDQVKEVVVIAREDMPGDKRLVAYVVPQNAVMVESLRAHLKEALPEYMVPSAFVFLKSLPLTQSGKLSRQALPIPDFTAYAGQQYQPPQGEVEEVLASIWRELLKLDRVDRHGNFFELGGHSLLVLEMLLKINQMFGSTLRATDVYKSPILSELAERICGYTAEDGIVDLSQEAALSDELTALPVLHCASEKAILLTGGTGFVGRFLLARLIQDTDATIYCLVRASSRQEASLRLRISLSKWDLWNDQCASRIVAIPGDLRSTRFGIDDLMYQHLCVNVDVIYHCATSMNHLETYALAKPANVDSAGELLKLATTQRPKLINYISTLSIFKSQRNGVRRTVNESSSIDHEGHLNSHGYLASKWVADKIFITAVERGIPCNIFRVGLVWPDTQQGRFDELQNGYRVLKSCLLSGYGIENYQPLMPPTPVDYVARAIVFLARQHRERPGIFHIASSEQMEGGIFERCNEVAGTSLSLMPYYDWICELKRLHRSGWALPAVPLIEFAFSMDEHAFYQHQIGAEAAGNIQFDLTRTHRELERAGIVAPVLDDDLLGKCIDAMFLRDADMLEAGGHRSQQNFAKGTESGFRDFDGYGEESHG